MSDLRVPAGIPTGGQFAAAMRAEAAMALPERTVHEMPAADFAAQFPPGLWSDSWEHLDELADEDVEEPADEDEWEEMGAHFSWGGECGWTVDDIAADFARGNPMRDPVELLDGHVTEGHHRVVAALRTGTPIRYIDLREDQP